MLIEKEILDLHSRGLLRLPDKRCWNASADTNIPCFNSKWTMIFIRSHSTIIIWCKRIWFTRMTLKYALHSCILQFMIDCPWLAECNSRILKFKFTVCYVRMISNHRNTYTPLVLTRTLCGKVLLAILLELDTLLN